MPVFNVPDNYAFDNYTKLVAAINDWLDRSDLTGVAQQMISLAEARMNRELSPLFRETSASLVTVAGFAALPANTGQVRRVTYAGAALRSLPQLSAVEAVNIPITYVEPYAYTLEQGGIMLWPQGAFTISVLYVPLLANLTAANPSNDLLSLHPDLYFFGTLFWGEVYEADDPRAARVKALWDEALQSAKVFFTKQKFGGPLVPRVGFVP